MGGVSGGEQGTGAWFSSSAAGSGWGQGAQACVCGLLCRGPQASPGWSGPWPAGPVIPRGHSDRRGAAPAHGASPPSRASPSSRKPSLPAGPGGASSELPSSCSHPLWTPGSGVGRPVVPQSGVGAGPQGQPPVSVAPGLSVPAVGGVRWACPVTRAVRGVGADGGFPEGGPGSPAAQPASAGPTGRLSSSGALGC